MKRKDTTNHNIKAKIQIYSNENDEAWILTSLEEGLITIKNLATYINRNEIKHTGFFSSTGDYVDMFRNYPSKQANELGTIKGVTTAFYNTSFAKVKLSGSKKRLIEKGKEFIEEHAESWLAQLAQEKNASKQQIRESYTPNTNFLITKIAKKKELIPDSYHYDTPHNEGLIGKGQKYSRGKGNLKDYQM